MTTRTGWCLPSGNRPCHDHDACRHPQTCGCPDHQNDQEEGD